MMGSSNWIPYGHISVIVEVDKRIDFTLILPLSGFHVNVYRRLKLAVSFTCVTVLGVERPVTDTSVAECIAGKLSGEEYAQEI